jgi:hypothetical protein
MVFTLGHFAASDRTAAIDSCDQALIPNPSSIPSVICFFPQNAVLGVMPALEISWAALRVIPPVPDEPDVLAEPDDAALEQAASPSAMMAAPADSIFLFT